MANISKYRFDGKKKFSIADSSRDETSLCEKRKEAEAKMKENLKQIDEIQQRLYADKKEGLVIIFQAMDAAGKDGTIRAVLQCLSPHGVREAAFKSPSATELSHDFLWRICHELPAKGDIAVFNRSHYEDVLIARVKELYKTQACAERIDRDKIIDNRYKDIKNFEKYLYNNSIRVLKIFLNVSKEEQARRFLSRIDEPEKNWKFSGGDFEERKYWDGYQEAFEACINNTATKNCPWYVVPADHKWYMRYIVSEIILAELKAMDPKYPEVTKDRLAQFASYKFMMIDEMGEEILIKPKKNKKEKMPEIAEECTCCGDAPQEAEEE